MYQPISVCLMILAILLTFATNVTALAQSGSTAASITGTIADEQGALISGALVSVKNTDTNLRRETNSGEDGSFLVSQLPPGNYEVMVTAEGFTSQNVSLTLALGITALIKVGLKLGATLEVIEVKATDIIDEGRTESSTNIDSQRIDNLPINRRNFLDFTLTSPRVLVDRTPAQGVAASSGLSFNGQPARFNNITIDGLENNDSGPGAVRATFSQDAVQEFQIVSDSYSAEFGRALGGIINIVTKNGSNEYRGSLFLFNRSDETSARNVFSAIEPDYKQYQFGATLSGPIKKDRVFFFNSFERLSIKQNNIITISDQTIAAARSQGFPITNGPSPFSIGTTTVLTRLDARLTSNDTLYLRYNGGFTYNGALETFGGLVGETSAGIQKLSDSSIAINNTYINPGLNLINETRFLYGHRNQDVLPVDDSLQVRITAPEGSVQFGRQGFLPQPRQERIYQIINNVSLIHGQHRIKFGADFNYTGTPGRKTLLPIFPTGVAVFNPLDFSTLIGIPGLPSFTGLQAFDPNLRTSAQRAFLILLATLLPTRFPDFPRDLVLTDLGLPFTYAQGFGDPTTKLTAKLFSAFLQNDIRLQPNLLLKAGIRYDLISLTELPSNNGNFSPRLALSYNPQKLEKLNLRASYGLFFGPPIGGPSAAVQTTSSDRLKILTLPFPFSIIPYTLAGHRFPESTSLPDGVPFIPQLGSIFTFERRTRNSYTQQVSAGFDYFIAKNTTVSTTYDFVRGVKLLSVRNINPIVRPIPDNPLASFLTGRVNPIQGEINQFGSGFDSYYHALTLSINRRFSNRFGFFAHYTLSKAIDNFVDIRSDQQEINDPLNPKLERGLSLQDVRSRFVLSGIWDLSYTTNRFLTGFQFSTIVNLNTGRPFNLLAGEDLNMDGDTTSQGDRPPGLGRNVGITPGFANVDLRLTRNITLSERYRILGFFEIFDLFNRVNISDINRIYPRDAQGHFNLPPKDGDRFIATRDRFRNAFASRQCQFGFRFIF
ncbi:MAG: TonB-dependent receptor [Acidobacteriota bacterium]